MSGTFHVPQAGGGDGQLPITAADVAAQVGGRLVGNPDVVVRGIAPLDRAGATDLSILSHLRYASWFATSRAGVVLVAPALEAQAGMPNTRIIVEKPMDALVGLLARFHRPEPRAVGVHATAVVAPTARLGEGVTLDAHAVVGEGAVLGDGCWIGAGATVGAGSTLGNDVRLHSNAVVYPFTELGDRVVLHAGAQVGREGFGFVPRSTGIVRIPHVGRCVLEHDVEVGANSCVDRGSVDDTVIGAGTKIDNLVQIGHNVVIGRHCIIVACTAIAGSAVIGDYVVIAAQCGVAGHVNIGPQVTLGARSGVTKDIPAGPATYMGFPAMPVMDERRRLASINRIPSLAARVRELEKRPEPPAP